MINNLFEFGHSLTRLFYESLVFMPALDLVPSTQDQIKLDIITLNYIVFLRRYSISTVAQHIFQAEIKITQRTRLINNSNNRTRHDVRN